MEFESHGGITIRLQLWNKTGDILIFEWSSANFSLVDNTGYRYTTYFSKSAQDVFDANEQRRLLFSGNFKPAYYVDGHFFDSSVTDMTFTVVDLSRIVNAKWHIEVPK